MPSESRPRTEGGGYFIGVSSGEISFVGDRRRVSIPPDPVKGGIYFKRGKSYPAETVAYFIVFPDK